MMKTLTQKAASGLSITMTMQQLLHILAFPIQICGKSLFNVAKVKSKTKEKIVSHNQTVTVKFFA